jgi:hypothetical protein
MKLRITPDGTVCGLWDDAMNWTSLGRVCVQRASHVEFSARRQMWYVRAGRPQSWWRRALQGLLRRPLGEILHWATTRSDALAWERKHYEPGGLGWMDRHSTKPDRARRLPELSGPEAFVKENPDERQ